MFDFLRLCLAVSGLLFLVSAAEGGWSHAPALLWWLLAAAALYAGRVGWWLLSGR